MTVNTYPKRPPPPPRIDLEPKEFDALIVDQGCIVRITPAVLCPRRSGDVIERADANHDLNCPICHGSMIIDLDELAYQTEVYIQSVKIERTFDVNSKYDVKDCTISFRSKDRVSYYFKIEVIDFGSLFNDVILRGSGSSDKLRYPTRDFEDGTFVSITDDEGVRYVKDTDFLIGPDKIDWLTDTKPESGKLYSAIYPINPTFRVLELLHETRYNYTAFRKPEKVPVQLPQQAHCRWDYLMRRGSDVLIDQST